MTRIDTEWREARAGEICRRVRAVWPGTPAGAAVEALRLSGLSEIPVVSGAYVVGVLPLSTLTDWVSQAEDPAEARSAPMGSLLEDQRAWRNMGSGLFVAGSETSLPEIEAYFHDNPSHQIVPVTDPGRGYAGIVTRAYLAAARMRTLAPALPSAIPAPNSV